MDLPNYEQKLEEAYDLLESGHFVKATVTFQNLTRKRPRSVPAWLGYARCAHMQGQVGVAEKAWQTAKSLEPQNPRLLLELGHMFEGFRQPEKACEHFQAATAVDPTAMNPRISMALLLEKSNRLDEARKAVDSCLALNGSDDQARYVSALLSLRENRFDDAEQQLRELIASGPKHEYVRYAVHYDLARVLDRKDCFDEAMQELEKAKKLVMALGDTNFLTKQYDSVAQPQVRAAKGFPKNIFHLWVKNFPEKKRAPIPSLAFLGGHPRSGTTLLEQVLGSHPDVAAIDEPMVIQIAQAAYADRNLDSAIPRLNVARQRYIEALQQLRSGDAHGNYLLEKNPSPTLMLPALLRVFPELRVILALRDPRDVVLSCYFQNIPLNRANSSFLSLDLLVKHYANLMDVWLAVKQWEGFQWTETRYEEVVSDLETEGRRVTKFLGLEWHEKQATFFEDSVRRRLYSPTYNDVRQPVYSRSVGRWRHYQKYLEPILPALEPYCRAFGYS